MPDQPSTPTPEPPPRRLTRSRDDRLVGGVAAGLARHLGVDPLLARIGFAVLSVLGGAGVIAYVALLVLVPDEGETEPAALTARRILLISGAAVLGVALLAALEGGLGLGWAWWLGPQLVFLALVAYLATLAYRGLQRRDGEAPAATRIAGALLLMIAAASLLAIGLTGSLWLAAAGGEEIVAGTVIALGATAVVASFFRPVRWLTAVALVLALPAAVVAAADIDLDGGVGERTFRPLAAADVEPRYQLGVGDLVVDLREVPWPAAGVVRTGVEIGVGAATVLVPQGVCVQLDGRAGMGLVEAFEDSSGGVDVTFDRETGSSTEVPRLELDGRAGVGAVLVDHERRWDGEDRGPFGDDARDRRLTGGREVRFIGAPAPRCEATR